MIAALPATIERHGWPRALAVPPVVQLAAYSGTASYAPHLDRWQHEEHNRREITILCYVNCDWEPSEHGGCLRLHPGVEATAGATAGAGAGAGAGAWQPVSPAQLLWWKGEGAQPRLSFQHNLLHSRRPLEAAEAAVPAWLHFGRQGVELKQWARASAKARVDAVDAAVGSG